MNDLYNPDFPADFITEYLEHGPENGRKRFRTYLIFRFFSALSQKEKNLAFLLREQPGDTLCVDSFDTITDYLEEDFYFSPSFREHSFDPVLLYYAIGITKDASGSGSILLDRLFSTHCPKALAANYDDPSFTLDFVSEDETAFWAALYICITDYEAQLPELLPEFSGIYWNELHFTCGDFVLYDFADEYFGIRDCFHKEAFTELIQTLVLATLQSFQTNLEQLTMDALFQLKHPSSRFAGLYRFGAVDAGKLPALDTAARMMRHLLEYAAAYELRNNLYDYHMDENNPVTLENWKEKLKWHYVQYTNVYHLALDSFYSAFLSRQLLKKQWEENVKELTKCES